MDEDDKRHRKDPTEVVGPYARIRIIVAVILVLVALGVLFFRTVLS